MAEDKQEELLENNDQNGEKKEAVDVDEEVDELSETKNKYLRLYADFENYKRQVSKDKEELIKYSNEGIMTALLTVIDHLELALEHASDNKAAAALAEGVEATLKELKANLEKFGLTRIEALDKPFDPSVHHAMQQIESEKHDENIVIKEFRNGYMLKDRVLRASLVGVSKNPDKKINTEPEEE